MFDRYLVTGATGFLGRVVAEELVRRKAQVHALVLHDDPYTDLLPKEVRTVIGDVCDKSSLSDFFADADSRTCVIHCAGIVSVASRPGPRLYQVNVGGTWKVLRQCMEHDVGKMVYVSSVHAIPEKPKGCIISEDCEFSPGLVDGDYAKSKAAATELVFDAAERGLNASIVFPSGIIGPGDLQGGSFTSMAKSFLSGKLPFAVRGGYDFVDVRDVARGILACSESGEPGKGYILSGCYVTIRRMLQLVGKAAKLKYRSICLPLGLARLAAPYYERRSLRERKPLFFTPYSVSVLASNGQFSHAAASERFAYQPRPIEETLGDMTAWLLNQK
jgi:dihydroflavonol-4-reductase